MTKEQAERDFLDASITVWREIDRLMTVGAYPGIPMAADLRIMEKIAWERYRSFLDKLETGAGEVMNTLSAKDELEPFRQLITDASRLLRVAQVQRRDAQFHWDVIQWQKRAEELLEVQK